MAANEIKLGLACPIKDDCGPEWEHGRRLNHRLFADGTLVALIGTNYYDKYHLVWYTPDGVVQARSPQTYSFNLALDAFKFATCLDTDTVCPW
jgi:hypothetical protein